MNAQFQFQIWFLVFQNRTFVWNCFYLVVLCLWLLFIVSYNFNKEDKNTHLEIEFVSKHLFKLGVQIFATFIIKNNNIETRLWNILWIYCVLHMLSVAMMSHWKRRNRISSKCSLYWKPIFRQSNTLLWCCCNEILSLVLWSFIKNRCNDQVTIGMIFQRLDWKTYRANKELRTNVTNDRKKATNQAARSLN